MREIRLTQGRVARVDDADYDRLIEHPWYFCHGYALRNGLPQGGKRRAIYMHRVVAGDGVGRVDHANGDTLDNRRRNLRPCSHHQNAMNQRVRVGPKTSRFKGVSFHRQTGRWQARLTLAGTTRALGLYTTEDEAARAYDAAAPAAFGEFARLNDWEQVATARDETLAKDGQA